MKTTTSPNGKERMVTKIEFIFTNEKINSNLINTKGEVLGEDCQPKPAKNFISKEYKNLPKITNNDLRNPTVKKCIPFLDAMTSGYIIPFYQDYLITINLEKMGIEINTGLHQMDFHSFMQLPENYQEIKKPMGKFTNKWIVRTPPGYSCLFVHPMTSQKQILKSYRGWLIQIHMSLLSFFRSIGEKLARIMHQKIYRYI